MRHKLTLNSKFPTGALDGQIFLETNEADLFFRWQKEIRLLTRKDSGSRLLKGFASEKN